MNEQIRSNFTRESAKRITFSRPRTSRESTNSAVKIITINNFFIKPSTGRQNTREKIINSPLKTIEKRILHTPNQSKHHISASETVFNKKLLIDYSQFKIKQVKDLFTKVWLSKQDNDSNIGKNFVIRSYLNPQPEQIFKEKVNTDRSIHEIIEKSEKFLTGNHRINYGPRAKAEYKMKTKLLEFSNTPLVDEKKQYKRKLLKKSDSISHLQSFNKMHANLDERIDPFQSIKITSKKNIK